MSKILVIGDLHIGGGKNLSPYYSYEDKYINDFMGYIYNFFDYLKENYVYDYVVYLGDILDNINNLSLKDLINASNMLSYFNSDSINSFVISGNHDVQSTSLNALNFMKMFDSHSKINAITSFITYEIINKDNSKSLLIFLPYEERINLKSKMDNLQDYLDKEYGYYLQSYKNILVFSHNDFKEVFGERILNKIEEEMPIPSIYDYSVFKLPNIYFISGHQHTYNDERWGSDNFLVLGSVQNYNFNSKERLDDSFFNLTSYKKYSMIFDTETNKSELIENIYNPVFLEYLLISDNKDIDSQVITAELKEKWIDLDSKLDYIKSLNRNLYINIIYSEKYANYMDRLNDRIKDKIGDKLKYLNFINEKVVLVEGVADRLNTEANNTNITLNLDWKKYFIDEQLNKVNDNSIKERRLNIINGVMNK